MKKSAFDFASAAAIANFGFGGGFNFRINDRVESKSFGTKATVVSINDAWLQMGVVFDGEKTISQVNMEGFRKI